MPYCVLVDIKKAGAYAFVTDLTTNDALIDPSDVVSAAIARADALIDAKVGTRYDVPFTTVPDAVEACSISLSCFNIALRCGRNTDELKAWADERDVWIDWLDSVAKGKSVIPGASARTSSGISHNLNSLKRELTDDLADGGDTFANYLDRPKRRGDGTSV